MRTPEEDLETILTAVQASSDRIIATLPHDKTSKLSQLQVRALFIHDAVIRVRCARKNNDLVTVAHEMMFIGQQELVIALLEHIPDLGNTRFSHKLITAVTKQGIQMKTGRPEGPVARGQQLKDKHAADYKLFMKYAKPYIGNGKSDSWIARRVAKDHPRFTPGPSTTRRWISKLRNPA